MLTHLTSGNILNHDVKIFGTSRSYFFRFQSKRKFQASFYLIVLYSVDEMAVNKPFHIPWTALKIEKADLHIIWLFLLLCLPLVVSILQFTHFPEIWISKGKLFQSLLKKRYFLWQEDTKCDLRICRNIIIYSFFVRQMLLRFATHLKVWLEYLGFVSFWNQNTLVCWT